MGSAYFHFNFLGMYFFPWIADPWSNWIGTIIGIVWFLAKTLFLIFFFIWIKNWTLPRFRYDQVMNLD